MNSLAEVEASNTKDEDTEGNKVVGVISFHEATNLLKLSEPFRGSISPQQPISDVIGTFEASVNLGKSQQKIAVLSDGVGVFIGDDPVIVATWQELESIVKKAKKGHYGCYQLYNDGNCDPWKISALSETTGNPAMLCAPLSAPGAPTMVLGGFTMHRITGEDRKKASMGPTEDTENKIKAAKLHKVHGEVLDTCLGLGYTAIGASKCSGVTKVTTIELDDVSIEMCRNNPWSQEIFKDESIELIHGDACEVVKGFPDNKFSGIIHDPPARALCKSSDMYGLDFYSQLWRVLKPGATLFHYIGNPQSKESGRLYKGIIDRLYQAGFNQVSSSNQAFGVTAKKQ